MLLRMIGVKDVTLCKGLALVSFDRDTAVIGLDDVGLLILRSIVVIVLIQAVCTMSVIVVLATPVATQRLLTDR